MRLTVTRSPAAHQDIIDLFVNIGLSNENAALRFLKAVDTTLERLAEMPGLGSDWESSDPELKDLRFRLVKGFKKYLIFYVVKGENLEVVRVLHGARDFKRLFNE